MELSHHMANTEQKDSYIGMNVRKIPSKSMKTPCTSASTAIIVHNTMNDKDDLKENDRN